MGAKGSLGRHCDTRLPLAAAADPRLPYTTTTTINVSSPWGGWQSFLEHALTSLAAAASIEVAVSSQEAALSVRPTVIEAGGEVCKDGHFGFCSITLTARTAGHAGTLVIWGSLVPREHPAPAQAMPVLASSLIFRDLFHPSPEFEAELIPSPLELPN